MKEMQGKEGGVTPKDVDKARQIDELRASLDKVEEIMNGLTGQFYPPDVWIRLDKINRSVFLANLSIDCWETRLEAERYE